MKFHQPSFSVRPKRLNTINMVSSSGKLIVLMMNSIMLPVADINQAIIPSPPIRINNTFRRDFPPNNLLQRSFSAIRNYFRINFSFSLKNAENDGFVTGSSTSFSFNSPGAEVRFVFRPTLDTYSGSSWTPIPVDIGHLFRLTLDTHSGK